MDKGLLKRLILMLSLLLPLGTVRGAPRSDPMPAWADEAIASFAGEVTRDEPAVVVLDSTLREVVDPGVHRVRTRFVLRVLRSDGAGLAAATLPYDQRRDKITGLAAWHRQASGATRKLDPRDAVDLDDTGEGTVKSEARRRVLSAAAGAGPGDWFAWEASVEQRLPHEQDIVGLRRWLRVARVVHEVRVPAGWRVAATPLHGGTAELTRPDDRTWRWVARDLPPLLDEPWSGIDGVGMTGLGLDLLPPGREPPVDWSGEIGRMSGFVDPAAVPDAAVRERAEVLSTGPDPLDAILREAQSIGYAAMSIDLRRGGGLRPRPAGEVLGRRLGDCKDKVTLARALLASRGIASYAVLVRIGPGMRPETAWPNLFLFDHLVLAVPVPPGTGGNAELAVPGLGTLLVFDPTDAHGIPGELPRALRGEPGLLVAPTLTATVRLPGASPGTDRRDETSSIVVARDGSASIAIRSARLGADGRHLRSLGVALDDRELRRELQSSLREDHPTAELGELSVQDGERRGETILQAVASDRSYARRVGPLLIVPQCSLERSLSVPQEPAVARRTRPIHLHASTTTRRTVVSIPADHVVDELPAPVLVEGEFGRYALKREIVGQQVILERELEFREGVHPVEAYPRFWAFLAAAARGDAAPVVLSRQP